MYRLNEEEKSPYTFYFSTETNGKTFQLSIDKKDKLLQIIAWFQDKGLFAAKDYNPYTSTLQLEDIFDESSDTWNSNIRTL